VEPDFHPEALAEYDAAVARYAAYDVRTGTRFIAAIEHAVASIVDGPGRWATYIHGTRRFVLKRFPYSIIYAAERDRIFIVAVAHQHALPGYWLRRLP
jgi:toxin ParE1/3/4